MLHICRIKWSRNREKPLESFDFCPFSHTSKYILSCYGTLSWRAQRATWSDVRREGLTAKICAICTKTVNLTESGFQSSLQGALTHVSTRGNLIRLQIVIAKSHRDPRKALLFGERRSRHASTRGVILDCSRRVRQATTTWQSQLFEIVIAKSARTVAISTDHLIPKPYGQFPPTFDNGIKPSPRGEGGRFAFGKSVGWGVNRFSLFPSASHAQKEHTLYDKVISSFLFLSSSLLRVTRT